MKKSGLNRDHYSRGHNPTFYQRHFPLGNLSFDRFSAGNHEAMSFSQPTESERKGSALGVQKDVRFLSDSKTSNLDRRPPLRTLRFEQSTW